MKLSLIVLSIVVSNWSGDASNDLRFGDKINLLNRKFSLLNSKGLSNRKLEKAIKISELRGGSTAVRDRLTIDTILDQNIIDESYNLTFLASTAGSIAAYRAAITILNSTYIDDSFAIMFARETNPEKFRAALAKPAADLARFAIRTRYFDSFVRDAVFRDGIRQVVVLGAGFDARPLRGTDMLWFQLPTPTPRELLEGHNLRIFELDLPDLVHIKELLLKRSGVTLESRQALRLPQTFRLSADLLREDWPAILRRCGFRPERPTCFLLEGLLYYFTPADVNRTLAAVSALAAPGSRLGLSAVSAAAAAGPGGGGSQHFRWGTDEPEQVLEALGWGDVVADQLGDPAIAAGWPLDRFPPDQRLRPRGEPGVKRTWYVTASKPVPPKGPVEVLRDKLAAAWDRASPWVRQAAELLLRTFTHGHKIRIPLPGWLSLH